MWCGIHMNNDNIHSLVSNIVWLCQLPVYSWYELPNQCGYLIPERIGSFLCELHDLCWAVVEYLNSSVP